MTILACNRISKTFVDQQVLKAVSFHIEEKQKAALVGVNGAGKSTLLKIIVGELEADEGDVTIAKGASLGYLAQHTGLNDTHTILESVLLAREDILSMEARLRSMEEHMEGASEEYLEEYMGLSHDFDLKGGLSYRSEVVGVLKGLGFSE